MRLRRCFGASHQPIRSWPYVKPRRTFQFAKRISIRDGAWIGAGVPFGDHSESQIALLALLILANCSRRGISKEYFVRFFRCGLGTRKAGDGFVTMKTDRDSDDSFRRTGRRRIWRVVGIAALVLTVILGAVRAAMPQLVRTYVNRTLDRNQLYSGKIGAVRIHLIRGAYSIEDISISKRTGNVQVPFLRGQTR